MEYLVIVLAGVCFILVALLILRSANAAGTLKVDHSNPEKDIYRFEIDRFDDLNKKKRIVLKVDHSANLSQE